MTKYHYTRQLKDLSHQSFTACMPLLTATNAFILCRKCQSSTQSCYLQCLHTTLPSPNIQHKTHARHSPELFHGLPWTVELPVQEC